jgi:hypothetical protein
MAHRSLVTLERRFFRAFFAALVKHGCDRIEWRSDETQTRFRRVYEYLRAHKDEGPNVARLVDRLRPDPISGSTPALDANLVHLQPGFVEAPNPHYEGVRLSALPSDAERLAEMLPDDVRPLINTAAEAFVARSQ